MKYNYEITLLSDAEPSSGLGSEFLDGMLPRNAQGNVCVPASHLKGLMRENLHNLLLPFLGGNGLELEYVLFGRGGDEEDGGSAALLHCGAAEAPVACKTLVVNRTAIEEKGVAKDTSLRSNEAISRGVVLKGTLFVDSDDPFLNDAARFALLSVQVLGGSRTRGAGRCRIVVQEHEKETPGGLLKALAAKGYNPTKKSQMGAAPACEISKDVLALKLDFQTETPLLLPEHPLGKSNVITSGFTVPATAVAGTLLTLLSKTGNDALASALFRADNFRCFPLLPTPNEKTNDILFPVYVSNTHKISKLVENDGNYIFGDTMLPDDWLEETYKWQEQSKGKSMKGVDGVLYVRKGTQQIGLLRNKDIPLLLSAHAVVNGDGSQDNGKSDNLFTTEAICVKHFSGIVMIPRDAAEKVLLLLGQAGRQVSFGKSRSLYGTGILKAEKWDGFANFAEVYPQVSKLRNRLFIVQTPIVFNLDEQKLKQKAFISTEEILSDVLRKAGWGELAEKKESTMTAVLFGWNQTVKENRIGKSCRTKAQRVILPGSVFLLKEPLKDEELVQKLVAGLGENRYAGFGAVLPHPMFATELLPLEKDVVTEKTFHAPKALELVKLGYELNRKCGDDLSASQIARLMRKVALGGTAATEFLKEQCEERPVRIQDAWKAVRTSLEEKVLTENTKDALAVLRVWHDLKNGGAEK